MKAEVTIETITPELAEAYLDRQFEGQRNIRERHVDEIALDMKRGSFKLSPDCITIIKGKLANGQHRLSAVIDSGVTCDFLVLRTDDEDLFKVIDSGAKRSVADCIVDVCGARNVSATAQIIMGYDRKIMSTGKGFHGTVSSKAVTRSELIDFIQTNKEQLQLDECFCLSLYSNAKIIQPTITAAFMFIARRTRTADIISRFITSVYTGNTINDAAADLRNRLVREMGSRGGQYRGYKFALLIKSFNAFAAGIRPKMIRIHPGETFPVIS